MNSVGKTQFCRQKLKKLSSVLIQKPLFRKNQRLYYFKSFR